MSIGNSSSLKIVSRETIYMNSACPVLLAFRIASALSEPRNDVWGDYELLIIGSP
jgi:hypothetical protein